MECMNHHGRNEDGRGVVTTDVLTRWGLGSWTQPCCWKDLKWVLMYGLFWVGILVLHAPGYIGIIDARRAELHRQRRSLSRSTCLAYLIVKHQHEKNHKSHKSMFDHSTKDCFKHTVLIGLLQQFTQDNCRVWPFPLEQNRLSAERPQNIIL